MLQWILIPELLLFLVMLIGFGISLFRLKRAGAQEKWRAERQARRMGIAAGLFAGWTAVWLLLAYWMGLLPIG